MLNIKNDNFDLHQIAVSGQCFRMNEDEEGFTLIAGDKLLRAVQEKGGAALSCTNTEYESFWRNYFDMDTDYAQMIARIDRRDEYLTAAAASCPGLRILRQDPWEMIVTFLISQQNNIPRIKKCVENICTVYGDPREANGYAYHAFPKPEALAELDEDALMACSLGYRSKYVVRTAKQIAHGEFDLQALRRLNYDEARSRLLTLYGIGVKVADCICLFGLHHVDAFPIDTHVKQILTAHYPTGFPMERYEGCAGIMQQYMFYYDLNF